MIEADNSPMERRGHPRHADVRAHDFAVADETRRHVLRGVDSDRKADSLRRQNYRGVDANHLASRVHQRSPGIAGIERGVGLNYIVD
jgi:hypothetical protein